MQVFAKLPGAAVLTYHGLDAEKRAPLSRRERKYWIRSNRFREHLELLRTCGPQCVRLTEFWAGATSRAAAIITFDDGRASDYTAAFPSLLDAGAHATFFLNTSTVGTPGYLTWQQIAEMHRHGMSFESHSHDHVYLSGLSAVELERQLSVSKHVLEERLGSAVRFLAAPYGDTNRRVLPTALALGYSAVCTSHNWPARPHSALIDRVVVYGTTTDSEFRSLVGNSAWFYYARALRTGLLRVPKEFFVAGRKLRERRMREVSA